MTSARSTKVRLAVDVGGTFIDYVLYDPHSGELSIEKQPATADRLIEEFVAGVDRLPVPLSDLDLLFHGTTIGLNAILQGRGANVALITTTGFRDVLAITRGARPEIYNWRYLPPGPLVPRYLRFEVTERLASDGSTLTPLDLDELDTVVDKALARGADAIAICFLHSFTNPIHEQEAARRITTRHPDLSVTTSHEVASEWGEYERSSTAVLNAYVKPPFSAYLDELTARLAELGYKYPVAIMQSNGGVMPAERAAHLPVRTLMSGPTGGVVGTQALAASLGIENAICFDIGGTSCDVAIIDAGEVVESRELVLSGRPIVGAAVEIESIGAGGGSIASVDQRGLIRVGPESAGAAPGPACFGHGGTQPTVTDSQLLLGRLDAERFLGARLKLDEEAARRAVVTGVAGPAGLSVEDAAAAVIRIAQANMTNAIRHVTIERGLDPREFSLVAYGGGGGLFAAGVADGLDIRQVVVPRAVAAFSALGLLNASYREDRVRTMLMPIVEGAASDSKSVMTSLEQEARAELARYGLEGDRVVVTHRVDVRYIGQHHTISIPLEPAALDRPGWLQELAEAFTAAHRKMYAHGSVESPAEIVAFRARGTVEAESPSTPTWPAKGAATPRETRDVYFEEHGTPATSVWDWSLLPSGQQIAGPALIEEWNSTVVLPPGWTATPDDRGNLILTPTSAGA